MRNCNISFWKIYINSEFDASTKKIAQRYVYHCGTLRFTLCKRDQLLLQSHSWSIQKWAVEQYGVSFVIIITSWLLNFDLICPTTELLLTLPKFTLCDFIPREGVGISASCLDRVSFLLGRAFICRSKDELCSQTMVLGSVPDLMQ